VHGDSLSQSLVKALDKVVVPLFGQEVQHCAITSSRVKLSVSSSPGEALVLSLALQPQCIWEYETQCGNSQPTGISCQPARTHSPHTPPRTTTPVKSTALWQVFLEYVFLRGKTVNGKPISVTIAITVQNLFDGEPPPLMCPCSLQVRE